MPEWRIYYSDGSVVTGRRAKDWRRAPADGVQVVVLMEPPAIPRWTYEADGIPVVVKDRQLWTGEDEYDPFGWGAKRGELIDDEDYFAIWNRASVE